MPKLTKDEYTIDEAKAAIATLLKEKVAAHSTQLQQLREREVRRAPLAKGELCLLCAELPRACTCLKKATAEEANREIGGFRSIASSPTFGGGKLTNAPKPQSRPGNGNRSIAGVIPNAKAEPTIPPRQAAEQRPMPGSKLPDDAKSKEVAGDEGSGGDIVEKRDMNAGAPAPAARPVVGVSGKQPVGQGGGDAHKVPHPETTASLKDVKSMAPNAPHPATTAGLKDVQALAPKAAWSGAGLPKLKAALAGVKAKKAAAPAPDVNAPGSPGHDPSKDWTSGGRIVVAGGTPGGAPAAAPSKLQAAGHAQVAAQRQAPLHAAAAADVAARKHANLRAAATADVANTHAQLAADKRAGGVGFLNNLISRLQPE